MARTNGNSKTQARQKPGEGAVVSEIIGRVSSPYRRQIVSHVKTVDRTTVDYTWWSHFRRGKQPGFELGGAFARPILNILSSWVLGQGFDVEVENETASERLAQFATDELDTLLTWYTDGLALGDSYLVVNADGSLTMLPPDTVEIITDPMDYRTVTAYRVTTKLETMTIIDEYRADGRTVTIQQPQMSANGTFRAAVDESFEFANPTGLMPVVPFHNEREANEVQGHPVYEGLLQLFTRYDDLLNKSLDGAEIMGRPIPVAISEDPQGDRQINSTRTEDVVDADGNTQTEYELDFSELEMFWLKKGGDFKFASPGAFATDSKALLKTLFYLMLEHVGIPEWAWGGAIASSMASVNAQMPAFVRLIERWRKALAGPLMDLLTVWYANVALFEFLPAVEDMTLVWSEVVPRDETVLIQKIQLASTDNLITRETELRLLDLVDNPESEVDEAEQQANEREQQFQQTVDRLMQDAGNNNPPGQQDNNSQDNQQTGAAA